MDRTELMTALAPYATHPGELDVGRAVLLVIDMQEFFSDIAAPIVPAVASLATAARGAGVPVMFTRHGHRDLASDGGALAPWWDDHLAMVGTHEWQLMTEIAPHSGELVFDKTRYSAFHGTRLLAGLRDRDVTDIVVCGVMTNCCCETTARDAFMNDFSVFVAADGTATANEDLHLSSLKGMAFACARVQPTGQLVTRLSAA